MDLHINNLNTCYYRCFNYRYFDCICAIISEKGDDLP